MHACAHCGAVLTDQEPLAVDGKTARTETNPAGDRFTITTYAAAPGAAPGGPATDEHTWFSGHTWRRLFCIQCSSHAGWQFRSRSRVFVGLISSPAA